MENNTLNQYFKRYKFGEEIFQSLMQYKVKNILLVSTYYDAFILEQDGFLSEQIIDEYQQFNLSNIPTITNVHTGEEAIEAVQQNQFDLVITMMRIGTMNPCELGEKIKMYNPHIPVILLLNVASDVLLVKSNNNIGKIDNVFIWNGDPKLFLAIIKYIEDMKNVKNDTKRGFVRVILIIEDNIQYYSIFLPLLYTEIMKQTKRVVSEELNDLNKNLLMRARPKILLAQSYEEAIKIYENYKDYLLCVVSDIKFPHNGILDGEAGLKLINEIRKDKIDIPVVLQSSDTENKKKIKDESITFVYKQSKTLLKELEEFIIRKLGFGDFIFRDKSGKEIARAHTMLEFEKILAKIPYESLVYHSTRNHFSAWLIARGEIPIAMKIKPLKFEDFSSESQLREYLLNVFKEIRLQKNRGKIINFDVSNLNADYEIIRLKMGSLGGKGRGIAFLNSLIVNLDLDRKFDDITIKIPKTSIIGTDEYDIFMEQNNLQELISCNSDEKIMKRFLKGNLSPDLKYKLDQFISNINYPLAVRSSSLFEDSQSQPFAGVYATYMLPNNHKNKKVRLKQLEDAIKLVYASVFMKSARSYIESLDYKIEEEKMGVIIQEIVGKQHDDYYYPHFSGVTESYNFYPAKGMNPEDGIASLAIGLGKSIVEGNKSFRFCPKHPTFSSSLQDDFSSSSQVDFYAIDTSKNDFNLMGGEDATLVKLPVKVAEEHGILNHIASVWDYQNNRIVDSLSVKGPRIITFSGILKYNYIPLAKILTEILDIGEKTMGVPVEIEFAVDLTKNKEKNILPTFYILQIRPLIPNKGEIEINETDLNRDNVLIYSERSLGNAVIKEIQDIIFLEPEKFDTTKTLEMQTEIEELNKKMAIENKRYILIGPGRWGSQDRFLGIPVKWANIDRARVIIELGLKERYIEDSQGSHFMHNIIAMNIGYLTIPFNDKNSFIKWNWLKSFPVMEKKKYFTHVRSEKPFLVKLDGQNGKAIIFK
ncbi:MAG TPA: response regulator [Bacteroidetes bacterium]|nr:response regulator [Bacteroidota bacterium]